MTEMDQQLIPSINKLLDQIEADDQFTSIHYKQMFLFKFSQESNSSETLTQKQVNDQHFIVLHENINDLLSLPKPKKLKPKVLKLKRDDITI